MGPLLETKRILAYYFAYDSQWYGYKALDIKVLKNHVISTWVSDDTFCSSEYSTKRYRQLNLPENLDSRRRTSRGMERGQSLR